MHSPYPSRGPSIGSHLDDDCHPKTDCPVQNNKSVPLIFLIKIGMSAEVNLLIKIKIIETRIITGNQKKVAETNKIIKLSSSNLQKYYYLSVY